MKKSISNQAKLLISVILFLYLPLLLTYSQVPPPPPPPEPGGAPTGPSLPHNSKSPIGGGLGVFLFMSGGYALSNLVTRKYKRIMDINSA